jgi:methylated-DNA-[protein]-cysteine S-methyltransferase
MNELIHTLLDSPLGDLTVVAKDDRICGLYFPHHWYRPNDLGRRTERGFGEVAEQLAQYFAGERRTFDLPTHAEGDDFQRRVWAGIDAIEYGRTVTYGDIAAELGQPKLAREVGAAVGRNPLSIVVPCHRVVGKDGVLTGYAGGLARKRFLLDLEQDQHARLF